MVMNRVWLPVVSPSMATSREVAPAGTVTKYDRVLSRSIEPDRLSVYDGAATGVETMTAAETWVSVPRVSGSSTLSSALCVPADFGLAVTFTVTGLFSGRDTTGPATLKVPSLFFQVSVCRLAYDGPLVRVMTTLYVRDWPAVRPPSRSYTPVPKPGVCR